MKVEVDVKTREILSLLQRNGYKIEAANKHYKLSNGTITVCVPRHKETNKFLAQKILKQARISL